MKLRTKLTLYLTAVLSVYAVIIFFVPTFVVVRDIENVGDQIHNLIIEKHRRMVRDQEVLIEEIFQQMRASIDASLLFVHESPKVTEELVKLKNGDAIPVWNVAAKLASQNPSLGFVQVSTPGQTDAVVLKPAEANLLKGKSAQLRDQLVAVKVLIDPETETKKLFLGVKLPAAMQPEESHQLYALISWDRAKEQKKMLQEEMSKIKGDVDAIHYHLDAGQIFTAPDNPRTAALDWLYKMEMIQILTPLVFEGVKLGLDEHWVPEALARIDDTGEASVIISDQLIGTTPVVNAAKYYEEHEPPTIAPPIAEGNTFIYDRSLRHVYLGNTLDINGVFLTLGSPTDKIARDFAVWSNMPVLVSVGDQLWLGFDGFGQLYSEDDLMHFANHDIIAKESGVFKFDGKRFFFANIAQFEGGRIGIYELSQLDGKDSVASLSLDMANKLAWKISFQIFVISLILIVLIVFILSRLAMYVAIRPITKLAGITQQVVAGQYDDIQWPPVGKRNDEVATLTHSFEQMVEGLREKEKIRGVLDKVVSKDVAKEILKSQIHLGGEDRNVSVLFSDIRGFTMMTERLSPKQTIEVLNSCMTKITQVIEGEGGVIDKFVGDAVMAIYGAPTEVEDHALRAVSSGILIVRAIKKWNDEREERGEERVEMGIGINTGPVVAGNMGAVDRLNYTVLGKNVNVAARLCSIAKPAQLIISEQTLNEPHVKDSFYVEPLPAVMLKGFSEPFKIYHVIDFKWEQS